MQPKHFQQAFDAGLKKRLLIRQLISFVKKKGLDKEVIFCFPNNPKYRLLIGFTFLQLRIIL